jgi:hypothetical protein
MENQNGAKPAEQEQATAPPHQLSLKEFVANFFIEYILLHVFLYCKLL